MRASPPPRCTGFALLELLILIAILALVITLLLPMMRRARESSDAIRCAANLRMVGESLRSYSSVSNGTLPQPFIRDSSKRYVHWSGVLLQMKLARSDDFTCPAFDYDGHPPTNPAPDNFEPSQVSETPGVVDVQAPRLAFALNERLSRARLAELRHPSRTILATEFSTNWRAISETDAAGRTICNSHRPICVSSRPSWIGRNHNDATRTNFLYVDGHVERKQLSETLATSEWGEPALVEAR